MPHGRSADGDDFASTDEVKIYKDEGEDEKRSSENLSEEKIGLVTETEEVTTELLLSSISGRHSIRYCIGAKPILVCLMAKCTYKTQTYRPTDNA